jgi:hypothetical protein
VRNKLKLGLFSEKENYFSWTVFYGEFDSFIKKTKRAEAIDIFFKNGLFSPL